MADHETVKKAIVAELDRQNQEGDVYLYQGRDDDVVGVDGGLNVDDLADAVLAAVEPKNVL
jgi:hypothetical protein